MFHKIKAKYQQHKLHQAQKKEQHKILHNAPTVFDEYLISWTAPERLYHERGWIWKTMATIMALSAIIWGIFNDSWTFSLAIGAFILAYYLTHLRSKPKAIRIKISDIGIKVGGKKYPYTHIKAFWIIYNPPYFQTLNLKVTGEVFDELKIQLNGVHPGKIREFLLTKIPELEGQSERLSDIYLRLFKI